MNLVKTAVEIAKQDALSRFGLKQANNVAAASAPIAATGGFINGLRGIGSSIGQGFADTANARGMGKSFRRAGRAGMVGVGAGMQGLGSLGRAAASGIGAGAKTLWNTPGARTALGVGLGGAALGLGLGSMLTRRQEPQGQGYYR